jgi:hypothetical protein
MKSFLATIGGAAALSSFAIAPAAFAGSGDSSVIGPPTPISISTMNIGTIATAASAAPTVSGSLVTTPATPKASASVLAGRTECGDNC